MAFANHGVLLLYSTENQSVRHLTACLIAVSLVCGTGICASANKMSNAQLGKLGRYVMLANLEANQTLLGNVRVVANALDHYVHEHGHLPAGSDEVDPFLKQLEETLPNNVFAEDSAGSSLLTPKDLGDGQVEPLGSTDKGKSTKVQMVFEQKFSEDTADQYMDEPPDEWRAEPGTITIVSNGLNLAAIWGAGSNCRPITGEDAKPQIFLLIVHEP
jgi:hypothetical protein